MGLLSAFGVGGGKLSIEPNGSVVQAGGTLSGKVVFTGGKRAQAITDIKVALNCNVTSTVAGPNGPERRTNTTPVVAPTQVTGAFSAQPGQRHEFAFSFTIPAGVQNTAPNVVGYRLSGSADIDGEVDPGTSLEITVQGGTSAPMAGAMPLMGGMMPPMGGGGLTIGSQVMAQWQDGQFHPGTIVATQNGMYGVDWTEPHLGASSWVQSHQIQPSNPMMGGGMMPPAAAPLAIGSVVSAQWQDGQWHPGTIVAMQNGMLGVDWTEPHLGASSWLQPTQVMAQSHGAANPMMGAKDAPKGGFGGGHHDPMMGSKDAPKGGFVGGQPSFGGDFKKDPNAGFGQQPSFGGDFKKDPNAGGFGGDPHAQKGGAFGGQQPSFGGDFNKKAPNAGGGFGGDPYAQKGGAFGGQQPSFGGDSKKDPNAGGGFGGDPYAQNGGAFGGQQPSFGGDFKKDPNADAYGQKGGGGFGGQTGQVSIGMHVHAQWQDGNWHAGKVVAVENGMIGVDWDDPNLGASTWVQPHQVAAK